jgi:hypothetical protein
MKTFSHLRHVAKFFAEWEMFQIKVIEKIKTHILCSITVFRKSCRSWDNGEKLGSARGAKRPLPVFGLVQVLFLSLAVNFKFFSRLFLGTTIWLDLFSGALLNKFAVSVVPSDTLDSSIRHDNCFFAWRRKQSRLPKRRVFKITKSKKNVSESHTYNSLQRTRLRTIFASTANVTRKTTSKFKHC